MKKPTCSTNSCFSGTRLFTWLIVMIGLIAVSLMGCTNGNSQNVQQKKEGIRMMEPAKLAATITDPKAEKPLIYSLGPFPELKGAIDIGPGADKANMEKLKVAIQNVPKDKAIVIYCGCCPFDRCPNVFPAMKMLTDMGYTNHSLLNLKTNFKTDWINHQYPLNN
ncbi:MAG: rhodanese-like domain-containing protein [Chitinophagales bacterium]|nr:rhodanese-like domain-containing protein [Chitinophagales bacterium]